MIRPALLFVPAGTMLLPMLRLLRCLVLVLIGLAFLGGTTMQALPPSAAAMMARASAAPMPGCADMAAGMMRNTGAPLPAAPVHKGITPDCVKLTHCLCVPDLPVQPRLAQAPVAYASVAYWSPDRRLDGRSPTPLPFPPRSA